MAWYRCGGGGVPASVKTDMNDVLNKKFGTSADYPPADWAPTVNLMGPLPEKTQASASVCSFDDGADDVPTSSVKVTIPPTLTGVSSVTVTQTGRNLLDVPAREELTRNGVISSVASDGTITASGQSTGNGDIPITLGTSAKLIGGQTYTFSINGTDTRTGSVYVYFAGGSYISINNANHSGTYTPSADQTITGVTLRMFNGQSITLSAKIMLEFGSTAHAYEPYTTPTQYTASLGRTIYGGTADIVNGTGTDNGKKIKLNSLSWSYDNTSYSYGIFLIPSNISDMTGNLKFVCTNYINNGHPRNQLLDGEIGVFNLSNSNKRLVIRDDACASLEAFLTKIADYDLAYESTTDTPFTFTGQEINTRLGYNAFWSDSGDTEVTYRADIDLLLGGN